MNNILESASLLRFFLTADALRGPGGVPVMSTPTVEGTNVTVRAGVTALPQAPLDILDTMTDLWDLQRKQMITFAYTGSTGVTLTDAVGLTIWGTAAAPVQGFNQWPVLVFALVINIEGTSQIAVPPIDFDICAVNAAGQGIYGSAFNVVGNDVTGVTTYFRVSIDPPGQVGDRQKGRVLILPGVTSNVSPFYSPIALRSGIGGATATGTLRQPLVIAPTLGLDAALRTSVFALTPGTREVDDAVLYNHRRRVQRAARANIGG